MWTSLRTRRVAGNGPGSVLHSKGLHKAGVPLRIALGASRGGIHNIRANTIALVLSRADAARGLQPASRALRQCVKGCRALSRTYPATEAPRVWPSLVAERK